MTMRTLFPVIATTAVANARDFYVRYFGFAVAFDAGWYVQLHGPRDGGGAPLELAFMTPEHDSLPTERQQAFNGHGVFLTIEIDDVDGMYQRFVSDGQDILIELRDEAWGQRHFAVRDPTGGMLDVVRPIPPSGEYATIGGDTAPEAGNGAERSK